ncbi:MAG: nucleotidyl transferase AbiEii/AbiGii toxin family protein [Rhodanobacter sp.]|jgi:predicted nucleotidyltransferase component of viral defense system
MRHTFAELLDLAAAESGGLDAQTRPAVVKELLHYDILMALSESEIAPHVVFQGGTALRLCYGGSRFSEDLDFVCGTDISEPFLLESMNAILVKQIQERYGLATEIHPPGADKSFDDDGITVKRWRYHIQVPGFAAAQKIHVEFCNVPAYDASPVLLQPRYGFLADRYGGIVLQAESESEILADKMVALAGRPYLKARDIWDIRWLMQRGHQVDIDLVRLKASDYGIEDVSTKLDTAVKRLRDPSTGRAFVSEMQRFVSPSLAAAMLREDPPGRSWLEHAAKTATNAARTLYEAPAIDSAPSADNHEP